MKTVTFLVVYSLVTISVSSQESTLSMQTDDPFSPDSESVIVPHNPDHLVPSPPFSIDDYHEKVARSLTGDDSSSAYMIAHSYPFEYAIIISTTKRSANRGDSNQWIVKYVVAQERIWNWVTADSGGQIPSIKVTDKVEKRIAPIPHSDATKIIKAWESVLKNTRYPQQESKLDMKGGTILQFYCKQGGYFGQTNSPNMGTPKMLVDLGERLKDYVLSDEKLRQQILEDCQKFVAQIADATSNK